jgi:hypothetical protein
MMLGESFEPPEVAPVGAKTVRRITWLIPIFGLAAGGVAGALHHWDWAEGLIFGAALAWLNFRWLRRGLEAFVASATAQAGSVRPRIRGDVYFVALFRYALIGLGVYVIFEYLHVPLVSVVLGLCALAAAIFAASVWEIVRPER